MTERVGRRGGKSEKKRKQVRSKNSTHHVGGAHIEYTPGHYAFPTWVKKNQAYIGLNRQALFDVFLDHKIEPYSFGPTNEPFRQRPTYDIRQTI